MFLIHSVFYLLFTYKPLRRFELVAELKAELLKYNLIKVSYKLLISNSNLNSVRQYMMIQTLCKYIKIT